MSMWWRRTAVLFVFVLAPLAAKAAEEQQVPTSKTLAVGTTQAPPFVMKDGDGTWSGIRIDLWRAIADKLQLSYQLQELDPRHLLMGLQDGSLDVAIEALTITAEREKVIDFTYPLYDGLRDCSSSQADRRLAQCSAVFVLLADGPAL